MQRPRLIAGSEVAKHIFNNAKRKLTLSKRSIRPCWPWRPTDNQLMTKVWASW
jgi:hypothetical protein